MSRHGGEKSESTAVETSAEDPPQSPTYFRPIATHPGAFDLADDAAAIAPPPGCDLVLTTDGVISGVHFFPDDPADAVARKGVCGSTCPISPPRARRRSVSCSRSGCRPACLPIGSSPLRAGCGEDAETLWLPLLGGDTDRSPGAINGLYRGARRRAPWRHGEAQGRAAGRRRGRDRHRRGRGAGACLAAGRGGSRAVAARCRHAGSPQLPLSVPQPRTAIAEALRRPPAPLWTCRTALLATWPKLCRASGVGGRCRDCGCAVVAGGGERWLRRSRR